MYKFFDKKIGLGAMTKGSRGKAEADVNEMLVLAQELGKPVI